MKTTNFESKPPFPPFQLVIPEEWRIVTSSGKGYKDVSFIGPKNKEDTLDLAFVVRFTDLPPKQVNLNELVDVYLSKRSKMREFALISRKKSHLEQHEAEKVEISFSSPKSIEKFDLGFMKIFEKRIMFIYQKTLCELIFSATDTDFLQYEQVVNKILNSIIFIE